MIDLEQVRRISDDFWCIPDPKLREKRLWQVRDRP